MTDYRITRFFGGSNGKAINAEDAEYNHPFNDGNKRAGFLAIGLFLARNGCELTADPVEAIAVILRLAEGKVTELKLASWIRQNLGLDRD